FVIFIRDFSLFKYKFISPRLLLFGFRCLFGFLFLLLFLHILFFLQRLLGLRRFTNDLMLYISIRLLLELLLHSQLLHIRRLGLGLDHHSVVKGGFGNDPVGYYSDIHHFASWWVLNFFPPF